MNQNKVAHILVVDDQPSWRNALRMLLEQEGYVVTAVADFESACAVLDSQIFDLITLDVRLIDNEVFNVQGLGLLQRIKQAQVGAAVIMLTGYPEIIREDPLEEYGADALLLKVPAGAHFDRIEFQELVRSLVAHQATKGL